MIRSVHRAALGGAIACVLVGCAGKVGSSSFEGADAASDDASILDDSGAGETSSPGPDGGDAREASVDSTIDFTPDLGVVDAPVDTGPTVAVDEVCDDLAAAICTNDERDCCSDAGYDFDADACRAAVHDGCDAMVSQVKSGSRTYDGSQVAACVATWKKLTASCSVSLITFVKDYVPCDAVFPGNTPPGGDCSQDSDCAVQAGGDSSCDASSKTCIVSFVVGNGDPCVYSGDVHDVCDLGLTCKLSDFGALCKPATPVGDACPGGASDISCGYGYVCGDDGTCTAGEEEGDACSEPLDCASWSCTSGQCDADTFDAAIPGFCATSG